MLKLINLEIRPYLSEPPKAISIKQHSRMIDIDHWSYVVKIKGNS